MKATVFGGDASNQLAQLAVAPDHSVYHAGTFDGADFEIQGQILEALEDPTETHVNVNYYILKLNGNNELQWLKRIETDFKTEIIGIDGKVYIHSKDNKSIDVTCLKSGIYVVKIYSDNNIIFHKIIKQ